MRTLPVGPHLGRARSLLRRLRNRVARRPDPQRDRHDQWFWDHYEQAVAEVATFLAEAGLSITGAEVADVGCGDGIIDLGLVHRLAPRSLVGFDVVATNVEYLARKAESNLGSGEIPAGLQFRECGTTEIPAPDHSFDAVVTWSAFEHISDPEQVLREIRRVLRPEGFLFLQLWPFYHSKHGTHLTEWYPEGFVQFTKTPEEIQREVLDRADDEDHARYMLREFEHLNRITLDDLGAALKASGFDVIRLKLISDTVEVPPEARDAELSALAIAGVVLLARPRP
ncbi:MAG: methyltransferase domain-containing protein [Actinobacteria bacterium]|uniref:Unannotated protein n=1 Tax=freshwater metagenome TaxID=449393 RepID=A0A6J7QQB0_9ZZZZ|nr:methyltransferase domain-containing protein [Actinomycetota bacterium]